MITNNNVLKEIINDFPPLQQVDKLLIANNAQLTTFDISQLRIINGDATFTSNGFETIDLTNLTILKGGLSIIRNLRLKNIVGGNQLKEIGGLSIFFHNQLRNIEGFKNLERIGSLGVNFSENIFLSAFGLPKLQSIEGGLYLTSLKIKVALPNLHSIGGNVSFAQLSKITDFQWISNLETISGRLNIFRNENLISLKGLDKLTKLNVNGVINPLSIENNPKLTDCCSVKNLVELTVSQGNTVKIRNNALNCSSIEEIENSCMTAAEQLDLEVTMTTTNKSPKQYTTFPVELTIKNNSQVNATNIQLNAFQICNDQNQLDRIVVLSGGSIRASKGSYNQFLKTWTIPALGAGEEATLSVQAFVLKEGLFAMSAEIVTAIPNKDIDSTPSRFESNPTVGCIATEDDEASLQFNGEEVLTTCDLLNLIDTDPCNWQIEQLATYHFRGRNYLVTTPTGNSGVPYTVKDCETGEIFCIDSNCRNFTTQEATLIEVIARLSDCKDCDVVCSVSGPRPFEVCGSDGKTYRSACLAECAGVTWTEGPCSTTDCKFLDTIDPDPCDPDVIEVALYTYQGRSYIVTVPDPMLIDAGRSVQDCETGENFCSVSPFSEVTSCGDFFNEAIKGEVISSRENCPNCGCPEIDDVEAPIICGSDGKEYSTACHAACAGVTWTEGPCNTGGITCGEITVIPGIDQITIKGKPGENYFFKVHRTSPRWEYVFECNAKCGSEVTIPNLATTTYFIDVYDKSWKLICDDIEVPLIAIDGFQGNGTASSRSSVLNTNNRITRPISIYPNPAQQQVTINLDNTIYQDATLYISNHLGQLVKTIPYTQVGNSPISLESFTNGVYQVQVVANGQIVAKEKLVVLR